MKQQACMIAFWLFALSASAREALPPAVVAGWNRLLAEQQPSQAAASALHWEGSAPAATAAPGPVFDDETLLQLLSALPLGAADTALWLSAGSIPGTELEPRILLERFGAQWAAGKAEQILIPAVGRRGWDGPPPLLPVPFAEPDSEADSGAPAPPVLEPFDLTTP